MNIYEKRPFKIRNADEYDLQSILELFINPRSKIQNPFEFENSIIKGPMGSGKTMYLRSNYAYHLYTLVPQIENGQELILPVFIKLSDLQHLSSPEEIYSSIIIKMMKAIADIYYRLSDAELMASIHQGMRYLPSDILRQQKYNETLRDILLLEASEYKSRVKSNVSIQGGAKVHFMEAAALYAKESEVELRSNNRPAISNLHDVYAKLLAPYNGKLLVLLDEAGSLNKSFFKAVPGNTSMFETLMNQLRTTEYVRTKIAVYPNSYSDVLRDTRYGDLIHLNANIIDVADHQRFRLKVLELIRNYLSKANENVVDESIVFEQKFPDAGGGDAIEQLIYASNGNMRTLVQLLDISMSEAFEDHGGKGKITQNHIMKAITKFALGIEELFTAPEKDFLNTLVKSCKSRGAYRFQFPNMSPILSKYTSKTSEINILNILELGSGRKGTVYAFDFTYCVAKDVPTHQVINGNRVDKNRSFTTGKWINRVQKLSDEIIQHANIEGKIEGTIDFVHLDNAFISVPGQQSPYFLTRTNVISEDSKKSFIEGKAVRFYPATVPGGGAIALSAEILD